jgi:hypothetical protein
LWNGKLALRHNKAGELGISGFSGIYNTWRSGGLETDQKRRCSALALDYNQRIQKWGTTLTGEWAWIMTDIPETYSPQFGAKQQGGFIDLVQPIWRKPIFHWDRAEVNASVRLEYIDYNNDILRESGDRIRDEIRSMMAGIAFRPNPQTIFRLNYRYMLQQDLLGNPAQRTGGFNFGVSSYF